MVSVAHGDDFVQYFLPDFQWMSLITEIKGIYLENENYWSMYLEHIHEHVLYMILSFHYNYHILLTVG